MESWQKETRVHHGSVSGSCSMKLWISSAEKNLRKILEHETHDDDFGDGHDDHYDDNDTGDEWDYDGGGDDNKDDDNQDDNEGTDDDDTDAIFFILFTLGNADDNDDGDDHIQWRFQIFKTWQCRSTAHFSSILSKQCNSTPGTNI